MQVRYRYLKARIIEIIQLMKKRWQVLKERSIQSYRYSKDYTQQYKAEMKQRWITLKTRLRVR